MIKLNVVANMLFGNYVFYLNDLYILKTKQLNYGRTFTIFV